MEACPKLLECFHLEMDLLTDVKKKIFNVEKQKIVLKDKDRAQNQLIAELNDILGKTHDNIYNAFIEDFEMPPARATPCRVNTNPIIFDEKFKELECTLSTSDDSNSDTELHPLPYIDTILYK